MNLNPCNATLLGECTDPLCIERFEDGTPDWDTELTPLENFEEEL